jgi:hypothetical protein
VRELAGNLDDVNDVLSPRAKMHLKSDRLSSHLSHMLTTIARDSMRLLTLLLPRRGLV